MVTGLAGEAHAEEAEEEARGNMEGAEVKSARSARSTWLTARHQRSEGFSKFHALCQCCFEIRKLPDSFIFPGSLQK